jgi:hypothetical protein
MQKPSSRLRIVRPEAEIFAAQVRALQGIYHDAHLALMNWGAWSRDLRRVFPADIVPSPTWREAQHSKFGDFGDEVDEARRVEEEVHRAAQVEVKGEAAEREPYEERRALILDERMHGPGGLSLEVRRVLRIAYGAKQNERSAHVNQFPRFAGCTEDAFRERLEVALQFVTRFA